MMGRKFKVELKVFLLVLLLSLSIPIWNSHRSNSVKNDTISSVFAALEARPEIIEKSYLYAGNLCEIDSLDSHVSSNQDKSSPATSHVIEGWIITESTGRTLPPLVFAILSNAEGVFWLEGKRVFRPDVGVVFGSHYFDQGGFKVTNDFSNIPAGLYRLSVAAGSEFVVGVCLTDKTITVEN